MDGFYQLFTGSIRKILMNAELDLRQLQEIRMRIGRPVLLYYGGKEYALTPEGRLTDQINSGYCMKEQDLKEMLETISGYSLYAFNDDLKHGFMTVPGGHRIGVAGKIVRDNDKIICIRNILFLNIRLAHQIKGCADQVMKYICEKDTVSHTLIVSPPCCGKTTLLRDIIRQISDGTDFFIGKTVGVVDERGELSGSYCGIPQNDLGVRTDIMQGCTKGEGMRMLLRSMAPQVLAVDELGNSTDGEEVESVFHCGCKLIATVHGNTIEDVGKIPLTEKLKNRKLFERYIIMDRVTGPGSIQGILDSDGNILYQREV